MGTRLVDPEDAEAASLLATAKRAAFADRDLAGLAGTIEAAVRGARLALGLVPGYAMVDTCAAEFAAETPYFYSTYASAGSPPEAPPVTRPAALVIGSGPVRIGQGIEFDYCAVQAADVLRRRGWSAVMVNSNPETVSTDFDASTRLYFEPLDTESVRSIIEFESPAPPAAGQGAGLGHGLLPAVVAFGGQTPLNLAGPLVAAGVPLLGSDLETIDQAEERTRFSALLDRLGIPQPEGGMAESIEEALTLAERIGYPVIVRPSFVIGGLAIDFAYSPEDLARHLAAAAIVDPDRPVRIDRFLEGLEVDVDAVCDGTEVLIPGLLEHVERAGIHSGDSIAWFPPQGVSEGDQSLIVSTMERISLALGVRGLVNAQFIVRDDGVYLIEVNPRASRTVPFLSKVTGVPMVELAVRISLGETLRDMGWEGGLRPEPPFVAVKSPAFSTSKLKGVDPSVGPFMQSTGEVIGIAVDPRVAMAKALTGAALIPPRAGEGEAPLALLSIADRDKWGLVDLGQALVRAGYRLAATGGTRALLEQAGIEGIAPVAKLGAEPVGEEAGILELIASGTVRLVVNTPTPRSGPVRDAADIRHATIAEGILCFTSIETGVAAAQALDPAVIDGIAAVRAITEWVPSGVLGEDEAMRLAVDETHGCALSSVPSAVLDAHVLGSVLISVPGRSFVEPSYGTTMKRQRAIGRRTSKGRWSRVPTLAWRPKTAPRRCPSGGSRRSAARRAGVGARSGSRFAAGHAGPGRVVGVRRSSDPQRSPRPPAVAKCRGASARSTGLLQGEADVDQVLADRARQALPERRLDLRSRGWLPDRESCKRHRETCGREAIRRRAEQGQRPFERRHVAQGHERRRGTLLYGVIWVIERTAEGVQYRRCWLRIAEGVGGHGPLAGIGTRDRRQARGGPLGPHRYASQPRRDGPQEPPLQRQHLVEPRSLLVGAAEVVQEDAGRLDCVPAAPVSRQLRGQDGRVIGMSGNRRQAHGQERLDDVRREGIERGVVLVRPDLHPRIHRSGHQRFETGPPVALGLARWHRGILALLPQQEIRRGREVHVEAGPLARVPLTQLDVHDAPMRLEPMVEGSAGARVAMRTQAWRELPLQPRGETILCSSHCGHRMTGRRDAARHSRRSRRATEPAALVS